MRTLTRVMQDLYDHKISCTVEPFWDSGFRIALGDRLVGEKGAFTIAADAFPEAGERLWSFALQHYPALREPDARSSPPPLSRVIAREVPDDLLSVDEIGDPPMDSDVLSYTVARGNQHFDIIWYLNTRGEVREEVAARRDPWRQSERFRHAMEQAPDEFNRLYLGQ